MQNVCLCGLSLVFYGWGNPFNVLLLLLSAVGNFFIARRIAGTEAEKEKNRWTACAVFLNMGMLFVYKYAPFVVDTVNQLLHTRLPVLRLTLPLGVSFFTFQALSYVLDVRMGRAEAVKNPGTLLLYLSLFPQLIAGPIIQWRTVAGQIRARQMTPEGAARGLRRFILGLSKKVLLADVLARVADTAFGTAAPGLGARLAWLGAICYTLQIYLDFSGYSDMAIGMGWMLGFSFTENFRHPLRALSMRDFWRRWHITLTDWFRDYVYIPLGGNRGGTLRTLRNLGVVFLLTGLWHGAAWNFVLWGVWNGLFVILERGGILRVERWPKALAHGYTLLVVVLGFVLFRVDSVAHALRYVGAMFGGVAMTPLRWSTLLMQCTPMNLSLLAVAAMVSVDAFGRARLRIGALSGGQAVGYALCAVLLVVSYSAVIASGFHPFIYFRF